MGIFSKGGGLDHRYSVNKGGGCFTLIVGIIFCMGIVLALLRSCGIDPLPQDENNKEVENKFHPTDNPWGE